MCTFMCKGVTYAELLCFPSHFLLHAFVFILTVICVSQSYMS